MFLAIKDVFPRSRHNLCAWHIEQNFKKKFCFLNRPLKNKDNSERKKLYQKIICLPYVEEREMFEEQINTILESDLIGEDLKQYLKEKYKLKKQWVKGYIKEAFCCGTCTTSRIESKHSMYKR